MASFMRRITSGHPPKNGSFQEDFCLDLSWRAVSGLLGCWGVGSACWRDGYCARGGGRGYYSLEFVTKGSFLLRSESETRTLSPGDIYLLGIRDKTVLQANPTGWKKCVFLPHNPVTEVILRELFRQEICFHPEEKTTEARIDAIYHAASRNAPEVDELVFALLNSLKISGPAADYPPSLVKALHFLETVAGCRAGRRALARAGGVSISTLNRLFRQHLHCAPGEYRQKKRMETACRILSLRSMSVKEAAAECGFSSSAFFCREFRKYTGTTPGRFNLRKNHRAKQTLPQPGHSLF